MKFVYNAITARYAAIARGLAMARGRRVYYRNESPEDIKWCPACNNHHVLSDDEAIMGPLNRLFHKFCPVCIDVHKEDLAALERAYLVPESAGDEG